MSRFGVPTIPGMTSQGARSVSGSLADIEAIRRWPAIARRVTALDGAHAQLAARIVAAVNAGNPPPEALRRAFAALSSEMAQIRTEHAQIFGRLRDAAREAVRTGRLSAEDVRSAGLAAVWVIPVAVAVAIVGTLSGIAVLVDRHLDRITQAEPELIRVRAEVAEWQRRAGGVGPEPEPGPPGPVPPLPPVPRPAPPAPAPNLWGALGGTAQTLIVAGAAVAALALMVPSARRTLGSIVRR